MIKTIANRKKAELATDDNISNEENKAVCAIC